MRSLEAGHVYEVHNADDGGAQRIEFVRRRDGHGEPLAAEQRRGGILCQELLRVLIDRVLYLYAEAPCEEDTRILMHLRGALVEFEARASRRAIERLSKPEAAATCPECHHVLCGHNVARLADRRIER